MNTTQKTVATLVTAVLLGSGLTACSSEPIAPAQIRQESLQDLPRAGSAGPGGLPLHAACAR